MNRLKYIKRLIAFYLPKKYRKKLQEKGLRQTLTTYKKIAKENKISREEILGIFNQINVNSDVLLHTSEMNIGKFLFPKGDLIQILSEKVNLKENTLIVASLSLSESMYDYIVRNGNRSYNVKESPIATGIINELFAHEKDAVRSLHPTHSAIAIGPRSKYYTDGHELDDTPFGQHSPWWKIIEQGGKLLMLGAPKNFTSIHAVEDAIGEEYPWKVYLRKKYAFDVTGYNNEHITVYTKCHNPLTTLARDGEIMDCFISDLRAKGFWESYPIGASEIALVDAKGFALTYLDWVDNGNSLYGRHCVSKSLHNKIMQIKNKISLS